MFPITDPSREADIRMRRWRAVWLLSGIALVIALASSHDKAAQSPAAREDSSVDPAALEGIVHGLPLVGSLHWKVQGASFKQGSRDDPALSANGTSLVVELPCAGSVTLSPRTDLSGRVTVSGGDQEPAASGGIGLSSNGSEIMLSGGCRNHGADLVVQAPAAMKLTLVQSGDTDFHVGAFTGPVHLSQHGSGDVVIDEAGPVDGTMAGSGDLSVGRLHGDLHLTQEGSGDISVKDVQAAAVSITANGTGDVSFAGGSINRLDAVMRGSGDLSVEAEVGDASVQAGQNSDVTMPNVRGRFERIGGSTE